MVVQVMCAVGWWRCKVDRGGLSGWRGRGRERGRERGRDEGRGKVYWRDVSHTVYDRSAIIVMMYERCPIAPTLMNMARKCD